MKIIRSYRELALWTVVLALVLTWVAAVLTEHL
jgi:hypothetical protein